MKAWPSSACVHFARPSLISPLIAGQILARPPLREEGLVSTVCACAEFYVYFSVKHTVYSYPALRSTRLNNEIHQDFAKCTLTIYLSAPVGIILQSTQVEELVYYGLVTNGLTEFISYVLTLVQQLCVILLLVLEREAFVSDESSVNLIVSTFLAERR